MKAALIALCPFASLATHAHSQDLWGELDAIGKDVEQLTEGFKILQKAHSQNPSLQFFS